jgi:hypothetical protein
MTWNRPSDVLIVSMRRSTLTISTTPLISEVTSAPVTGMTVTSACAVEDTAMIPPASAKANVQRHWFSFHDMPSSCADRIGSNRLVSGAGDPPADTL